MIDNNILEHYFIIFAEKVMAETAAKFFSFECNDYLRKEEGYKTDIFLKENKALNISKWYESEIGTGEIFNRVLKSVKNAGNLIHFHQKSWFEKVGIDNLVVVEKVLFDIYKNDDESSLEKAFEKAITLFGRKYDLISYLFFIKDFNRFLPISPRNFDAVFEMLRINLKTSSHCSWDNYRKFIFTINLIKEKFNAYFGSSIRLIDAHSFVWIIRYFNNNEVVTNNDIKFDSTKNISKSTESVVHLRIGQSSYRSSLIKLWDGKCSVSGLKKTDLLVASHIKPWKDCKEFNEWLNPYNGFLLTPNLDSAFDKGYISFDNNGEIIISSELTSEDCRLLGISKKLKLNMVPEKTKNFLEYHRKFIFRK